MGCHVSTYLEVMLMKTLLTVARINDLFAYDPGKDITELENVLPQQKYTFQFPKEYRHLKREWTNFLKQPMPRKSTKSLNHSLRDSNLGKPRLALTKSYGEAIGPGIESS